MNLSVGNPEAHSAVIAAFGPGIGITDISAAIAALTILNPGSDIPGVPASLKSTAFLFFISFNTIGSFLVHCVLQTE